MIKLTLPVPPSVNNMYRSGKPSRKGMSRGRGARFKTSEAKAFEREAMKVIVGASGNRNLPIDQRVKLHAKLASPLLMDVTFFFPDLRRRDADNCCKLVQDVVARAFGFDDSEIYDAFLHKRLDRENPRCEVILLEAEDADYFVRGWQRNMGVMKK